MKKVVAGLIGALAVVLLTPATSLATSIPTPTVSATCGTCGDHNTAFDITYSLENDATNLYRLEIKAIYDPNGLTPPNGFDFTWLNAISFKIDAFSMSDYQNGTPWLAVAPAEDQWKTVFGGINAGGCDGAGNGFWCANSKLNGAAHGASGDTDTWIFFLDMNDSLANLPGPGGGATGVFKAQFLDASGNKIGSLLSESITLRSVGPRGILPEPATILLLGSGLGWAVRRRRRHPKVRS